MDKIQECANTIDTSNSITEKVEQINKMNIMIAEERKHLQLIQDTLDKVGKVPSKYKKLTLEQLQELFDKSSDINEKVSLYCAINYNINNIIDTI